MPDTIPTNDEDPSFSVSRKWSQRLNVLVGILSLFAIVGMLNYLAARHYTRIHWTDEYRVVLSPLSQRLLLNLTNEVHIVCHMSKEEPLFTEVVRLLREYRAVSSKINLEVLDPVRDPGASKLLKVKFNLSPNDNSFVLFETQGRMRLVRDGQLSELDFQPLIEQRSKEIKRKDFRGELLFSSAIHEVTTRKVAKAYFIAGHGGGSPLVTDDFGFSELGRLVAAAGADWAMLDLTKTGEVPEDCGLLLVVSPQHVLPTGANQAIQQYLERGGRALFLFDYSSIGKGTGFEGLLQRFGVQVGQDLVKDPQQTKHGFDIVTSYFGTHDIVKPLAAGETSLIQMVLPRTVTPLPKNVRGLDTVSVEPLLFTSPQGIRFEPQPGKKFNWQDDSSALPLRTNYCLAVAAERGGLSGVAADRGTTRIVVVGDATFLNNQMYKSAANFAFGNYAVAWLLDRNAMLGEIGPRPFRELKFELTRTERMTAAAVLMLALPGATLFLGFLVWLRRRS